MSSDSDDFQAPNLTGKNNDFERKRIQYETESDEDVSSLKLSLSLLILININSIKYLDRRFKYSNTRY